MGKAKILKESVEAGAKAVGKKTAKASAKEILDFGARLAKEGKSVAGDKSLAKNITAYFKTGKGKSSKLRPALSQVFEWKGDRYIQMMDESGKMSRKFGKIAGTGSDVPFVDFSRGFGSTTPVTKKISRGVNKLAYSAKAKGRKVLDWIKKNPGKSAAIGAGTAAGVGVGAAALSED